VECRENGLGRFPARSRPADEVVSLGLAAEGSAIGRGCGQHNCVVVSQRRNECAGEAGRNNHNAIDDARSLSLFAAKRVIVIANAELGLPRQRANEEEDAEVPSSTSAASLDAYMKDPTPGVVLLLEAVQFDFQGEEKKRLDRIAKFYSSVTDTVELRRYPADEARGEAQILARQAGISIDPEALSFLVEALGADVARIAVEIEKLRLYAGSGRTITLDEISQLVPEARASTIFALVSALGRRDRGQSLQILDTLTRDGEYLPLALSFLSAQFRMALVSKESGLRGASQIQNKCEAARNPRATSADPGDRASLDRQINA
jgi:DNA polymerase-3 subunit delta